MSVYTTVFAASIPIGGLAVGALASTVGVSATIAVGGLLSLAVGLGAYAWWRRIGSPSASIALVAAPEAVAMATESATAQSTAPITSAALRPPNPNEVLSTRR
jgi:hypothetical protein